MAKTILTKIFNELMEMKEMNTKKTKPIKEFLTEALIVMAIMNVIIQHK